MGKWATPFYVSDNIFAFVKNVQRSAFLFGSSTISFFSAIFKTERELSADFEFCISLKLKTALCCLFVPHLAYGFCKVDFETFHIVENFCVELSLEWYS